MGVNLDKPDQWKEDVRRSVDLYNDWFVKFAPKAFRDTRAKVADQVEVALKTSDHLKRLTPELLRENPSMLPMLRMSTAPPIARDRLIGLAEVSPNLVHCMEDEKARLPRRMAAIAIDTELGKVVKLILKLADRDIFTWLANEHVPDEAEMRRAATIVADRLCGAIADPIVRNAQERRQLDLIRSWLERRGYSYAPTTDVSDFQKMRPGTFTFRLNVPVILEGAARKVNIPIDALIMRKKGKTGAWPLLIEAKSAGDYTNTNKRRKEEAVKMVQLKATYGQSIEYILFLCGYFDSGYLGYEAAEGMDWVWEHRIDDLVKFGV